MKNFVSTKKIFVALLLIVSLMFLCNFALFFNLKTAEAYIYQSENSGVSVQNGDFVSNTHNGNSAPYSVSGWDLYNSSLVVGGAISVNKITFNDNNSFGLSENPKTDEAITNADDHILMFRSKNPGDRGHGSAVSEKFTFTDNKFFRLDVHVKTINGAVASLHLSGGKTAEFVNVHTSGVWKTYSFYVATDFLNEMESSLTLCFGGNKSYSSETSGAVFFDSIKIFEISNEDFYLVNENPTAQQKILNESRTVSSSFLNATFEDGMNGWKIEPLTGNGQAEVKVENISLVNALLNKEGKSVDIASTNIFGNKKVLVIWNKDAQAKSKVSSNNNWAVISQHKFYALTFLLKTGNLSSSGLSVTLTPKDYDESQTDNALSPLKVSGLTSGSATNALNGFELKTVYLKGSMLEDKEVSISFSLENSAGYAIVDQLSLLELTQKEYSEFTSDSNSLDFASEVSDSQTISNGKFSLSNNEILGEKYPLSPKDWNFVADESNASSGIVRINPAKFDEDKISFGCPVNPGVNIDFYRQKYGYSNFPTGSNNLNENVLMVRNNSLSDAYFTSSAFTISASSSTLKGESASIVKISVGVKTMGSAKAFVKLIDSKGNVLAIFDNLISNEWKMHNFFIRNGLSSLSEVKMVLGVYGEKNGNNYAFFDDVSYSTVTQSEVLTGSNSYYLDFVQQDFSSHSGNKIEGNIFEYPNFSTLSATEGSYNYFGVTSEGEQKVFVINNVLEGYQTLISNYAYSLTSNKYYEVSVRVKTQLVDGLYGGHFEVVALDSEGNIAEVEEENKNIFSNIFTTTLNDGWTKYSMFILCEKSQSIKVILGLGTQENEAQGKIYFDDLIVREVEKTTYAQMNEDPTTIVSATVQLPDEPEENDGASSSSSDFGQVNIWALVSSLLLVAALLFALAGYLIRQIPKKKVKKVSKKNNYVISIKKVKEQDIQQELKVKREKDLAALKGELAGAQKEYGQLQQKYNEDIADKDEVESREIYKEFATSANKMISRIEYLNSAIAYLNDSSIIRQSEVREIKRRNKQNKLEFEREMQKEYEKISSDEASEKPVKNRKMKKV